MVAVLVLGAVVIVLTALDIFLTVMHPTRRGLFTSVLAHGSFLTLRTLARVLDRRTVLNPAGPLAMLTIVVAWVVMLWLGYALVYLPNLDELSWRSAVDYGGRDILDALYFSGMALTTVGFGDIVAGTEAYRIVSVVQAANGFAVFTAAISFVLSVYPQVNNERIAARSTQSQAGDPAKAARMVRGESYLITLQQQLLTLDENTERFPVLFYFHSRDPNASMYTFLRGVAIACLMARWAVSPQRVEHARRYGEELQQNLERTIDHYAMRFMRGPEAIDCSLALEDARRRLENLVSAAGADGEPAVLGDDEEVRLFGRFAGRCDQFLGHVAGQHRLEHRPLGAG